MKKMMTETATRNVTEELSDAEVESVLREIRERVRSELRANGTNVAPDFAAPPSESSLEATNGDGATSFVSVERNAEVADALERASLNLATTERAWNRLPPMMSYRTGATARLELWIKRQIKRALHWFTWEQINFNSAAHQTLVDLRAAVAAQERIIGEMQKRLAQTRSDFAEAREKEMRALHEQLADARTQVAELHSYFSELHAQIAEAHRRIAEVNEDFSERIASSHAAVLRETAAELERALESQKTEFAQQFGALAQSVQTQEDCLRSELRERAQHILEEQRACYRQLALQAGETAVLFDRARRSAEARLAKLERGSQAH